MPRHHKGQVILFLNNTAIGKRVATRNNGHVGFTVLALFFVKAVECSTVKPKYLLQRVVFWHHEQKQIGFQSLSYKKKKDINTELSLRAREEKKSGCFPQQRSDLLLAGKTVPRDKATRRQR